MRAIGWLFLAAGLGMASTAVVGPLLTLGAQRGWAPLALSDLGRHRGYPAVRREPRVPGS
jgi:hypothetical protein